MGKNILNACILHSNLLPTGTYIMCKNFGKEKYVSFLHSTKNIQSIENCFLLFVWENILILIIILINLNSDIDRFHECLFKCIVSHHFFSEMDKNLTKTRQEKATPV